MRRLFASAAVALAVSLPVHAAGPAEGTAPLESFAYGIVQEQDVALVFDYLRDALGAAIAGREPSPPPEELTRRAEAIGEEVRRRGEIAARALLDAIERSLRGTVPEAPRPPARSSLQRT